MDGYEEIYYVIKKWFDETLQISIDVPKDLSDGRYYLELLKKCVDVKISNTKDQNYETIENVLNEFYEFPTGSVVDYLEFFYTPNHNEIITLCIYCFVFCQHYKKIPKNLAQDDYRRLMMLTTPLYLCLKEKRQPTMESFKMAIEKAKERELEEISLSSSSMTPLGQNYNDSLKDGSRHHVSDDEFSNSSNLPSLVSESSFHAKSMHDSLSDVMSHEQRNKFSSLRKQYKNVLNTKARKNQNIFLSPAFRRTANSPKLNESRKLEQRRLKTLDYENHGLKQEICQLNEDILKLTESEKKLSQELGKLKLDNRKLMDNIDCLTTTAEENAVACSRKDKDLEKMRRELDQHKKTGAEKCDEIRLLENSNKKLRQDIHDLNNQLKTRSSQCELSMKNEVDIGQEKRVLQSENDKLKIDLQDLQRQILDMTNTRFHSVDRDTMLESPVSNIEMGESLDIINEFKLAEARRDFEERQVHLEHEIQDLRYQLETERNKVLNHEEFSQQCEEFRLKLAEKEEEICQLKKTYEELEKVEKLPNTIDEIVALVSKSYQGNHWSGDEANRLLKSLAGVVNIDLDRLERNHDVCRTEISSLHQKLQWFKDQSVTKDNQIEDLKRLLDESEQQMQSHDLELQATKAENVEINRIWQNHKARSDETEFKLKKTLFAVEEERRQACAQNSGLKRDLLMREAELQKSNQEFNMMRLRLDECLFSLRRMAKDCDDYEQVINDLTEQRRKTYRTIALQTDNVVAVAPSTNNTDYNNRVIHHLERGDSFRRPKIREMPTSFEALYGKKNYASSTMDRMAQKSADQFRIDVYDYQNPYHRDRMTSPHLYKPSNINIDSRHIDNVGSHDGDNCLDPKWVKIDKYAPISRIDRSIIDNRPVYSPSVKPDRLHQMIERNLQQPEHLKSSYPIETQALEQDYLAHLLMKEIDLGDDSSTESNQPINTGRSSTRHYAPIDPMNLRSNMGGQSAYNFNDNAFSDNLIKGANTNGVTHRNIVLSARSNNQATPRNDSFRLPLTIPGNINSNRDSDRENAIPTRDQYNAISDRTSESSSISMKFEIVNTPKNKKQKPRPVNKNTVKKTNRL